MSMVTQLIAAVTDAQTSINEQIAQLMAYQSELTDTQGRIEAALAGSALRQPEQLVEQLALTHRKTQEAIDRLLAARDKLEVVKRI